MGRQNSQVHTTVTLCHLLVKGCGLPLRDSCLLQHRRKAFFLCLQHLRSGDTQAAPLLGCNSITCRNEPQAQGRVCEDHGHIGAAKPSSGLPSLLFLVPGEMMLQHLSLQDDTETPLYPFGQLCTYEPPVGHEQSHRKVKKKVDSSGSSETKTCSSLF